MKILLTGATGYIGKRLLPVLVKQGHTVVCCVRDSARFHPPVSIQKRIETIECDLLDKASLQKIPKDISGAYYLVHSMASSSGYQELEKRSAINFREVVNNTNAHHVIYLSGIVNQKLLSDHLESRKQVEDELAKGDYHFTALRAGIIIGSGSASFEIIRDLVEKLPVMIAPKWLHTKCQPIAISDVIRFLGKALFNEQTFDQNFDIGGPDVLSYKQMLLGFAKTRGLKRRIYTVPVMSPRLSSYWLYFITVTSYKLAVALVNSMKVDVTCRDCRINNILQVNPIKYEKALQATVAEVEENLIISSWKDALVSGEGEFKLSDFIDVPTYGCFVDKRIRIVGDPNRSINKVWQIGGTTGWYYANWLWSFRGFLDKTIGGAGLRKGRTSIREIFAGDTIDFWRVIYANKEERRLLLFAEIKLPGEAWLEFKLTDNKLEQTATFRPKGLLGRLYWYSVYPLHSLIFKGMINRLSK